MKYTFLVLLVFALISCGGDEPAENTDLDSDENWMDLDDTIYEDEAMLDGEVFTAWAAIDGPDEYLWVTTKENFVDGDEVELPDFEVLHIIPEQSYSEPEDVEEWMLGLVVNDFSLWGKFEEFSGPVVVYYDGNKQWEMASYNVVNGKPDGQVTVQKPTGSLYLDWEYELGEWVVTNYSPYGADWYFNQSESSLEIMDVVIAMESIGGRKYVELMSSVRYNEDEDNNLTKILEKESYQNPFQINGEIFTGTLTGYYLGASVEGYEYFTLNFTEGWLDGDVKIYNDWGELELHEGFVMGELDTTFYVLDYSEMDGMAKPIIYLYPEKETVVDVSLKVDGELTHTNPKYNDGWKVLAKPDGTLYDETGKEYYALYWEGIGREDFTVNEGFVVPGDQTVEFLEKSLDVLGLNRREANEFIVYWLPKLENNSYNLIHFSSEEYEEKARLKISPEPETLIRVMMVYKPLDEKIEMPVQDLNKLAKERKGFTVVEWGGSLYQERLFP